MRSLPFSGRLFLMLSFAAMLGCSGDNRKPPTTVVPDGAVFDSGPKEVISLDHWVAPEAGDVIATDGGVVTDTSVADTSTTDTPVGVDSGPTYDTAPSLDGPGDHPGVNGSIIKVTVLWEDADGGTLSGAPVVKTADVFRPWAEVAVTTPAGSGEDVLDVDSVRGEIWKPGSDGSLSADKGAGMLSSSKLTQSASTTMGAEGAAVVTSYSFRDTPIDLSALATGKYVLRVLGRTQGGAFGDGQSTFYADSGLVITINSPVAGSSYKGSVTCDVKIANPFPTDPRFDLDPATVTMSVSDKALTPQKKTGDIWTSLIAFNNYQPPLDGEHLFRVEARNMRGTLVTATARFIIDNIGPTISATMPATGELIGGIVKISASVADPAGVLDSSVVAVVANGAQTFQVRLLPSATTKGTYSAFFDTRLIDKHSLFPSISFRASDRLGNESSVGYLLALDNQPPTAELDPVSRVVSRPKDQSCELSWPFDPVGPDAADDGELVGQLFDLRAMIRDDGNTPLDPNASYDLHIIAKVDRASVNLMILPDTSQPLVVDTNADGVCDSVNPLLEPTTTQIITSKQALLLDMVSVAPSGMADFTPNPSYPAPDPNGMYCGYGAETAPPGAIISIGSGVTDYSKGLWGDAGTLHSHKMTYAPGYMVGGSEPLVWVLPPLDMTFNVGRQFDSLASNIPDGWACVAVRAADQLGNIQVSKPIRVCIDSVGDRHACTGHQPIAAVTCSGDSLHVYTPAAHGITSGEEVIVRNVINQTSANGRWRAEVIDSTEVHLLTLAGVPSSCVAAGGVPYLGNGTGGHIVRAAALPDCTGTQTSTTPAITVSSTPCTPWSVFSSGLLKN